MPSFTTDVRKTMQVSISPGRAEVADAATVNAALVDFELVDDLHRPHLWRARDGAGWKARAQRVDRVVARIEPADHVRHDVHDVAVALDRELFGHADRPDLGDATDIVAAEIEQHQVFGAFLLVSQKIGGEPLVLGWCRATPTCARDRANRHCAVTHAHQNFRAGAHDLERAEVEEGQERRGVHPPQRAIKRKGRQRERRSEALAQHDLEDVAGAHVFARTLDHREKIRLRRVGALRLREKMRIGDFLVHERTLERRDDRFDALARMLPRHGRGHAGHGVAPASRHSFRHAPRRRRRRSSVAAGWRREHRSDRISRVRAAPSRAPCRSRDSRRRRLPSVAARLCPVSQIRPARPAARRAAARRRAHTRLGEKRRGD